MTNKEKRMDEDRGKYEGNEYPFVFYQMQLYQDNPDLL
jgi:hypothetical protein